MRNLLLVAALGAATVLGMTGSAVARHVFGDVSHAGVHAEGIHWAHEQGVITGFDDGDFRPRTPILRDQMASMLHRYDQHVDRKIAAARPGAIASLPPFSQAGVTLDPGGVHVPKPVYVADTPELRQRGLTGVEDLPQEAGMLFLFPQDTSNGFWMKDTLIPLSIAFLAADGTVLAVLDMEPCEADPCPTYRPGVSYRAALEVNQGRFDDLGLAGAGWSVAVPPDLQAAS